jgi:hypothetical protein
MNTIPALCLGVSLSSSRETIRGLRDGRWESNLWYWRLRAKQVYRVIVTGRQGTIGTLLNVLSIALAIAFFVASKRILSSVTSWLVTFLILGVAMVASAMVAGFWALRTMSPDEYAQFTIGDSTPSEILQFTAMEIRRACRVFRDEAAPIIAKSEWRSKNKKDWRSPTFRRPISALDGVLAKQYSILLRIAEMLRLAHSELKIELHRLRDLLVEYDPSLHWTLGYRFLQNLRKFTSKAELTDIHRKDLRTDNEAITDRAAFQIKRQTEMLEYTALHASILDLATTHSAAEAVQEYARALSSVSQLIHEDTPDPGLWDPPALKRLGDGVAALRFLACKQRTHSGVDLNRACLNMVDNSLRRARAAPLTPSEHEKQELRKAALDALGKSFIREEMGPFSANIHVENDGREAERRRRLIDSLQDFWPYAMEHIQTDRDELVKSFNRLYERWADENRAEEHTLLITHGISTTVREILKQGLPAQGGRFDPPDIFVIGTGSDEDIDSRLIVSALKAPHPSERRFHTIGAGKKDALAKLIERNTKVMVVLGAEAFDRKGRIVHPHGLLEDISDKLGAEEAFCVVVVAEGYKFYDNLLDHSTIRYHLDRVNIYDPELISVIIGTDVELTDFSLLTPQSGWLTSCALEDKNILVKVPGNDTFDLRYRESVAPHQAKAS